MERLIDGERAAGEHIVTGGQLQRPGVYLVRLEANGAVRAGKWVRLN